LAGKRLSFFATPNDLRSIIEGVEARLPLNYFVTGLFDVSDIATRSSLLTERGLGLAWHPDGARGTAYLVLPSIAQVAVREVRQRSGGTKYAIDQLNNPHSVVFAPGGTFEAIGVVAGSVGTVHGNSVSSEIFKVFASQIKKDFSRGHSGFIGPDASDAWHAGCRLAADLRAPVEYDLARR
jgi:hypothetical protein